MKNELVSNIKKQTKVMFINANIMLQTSNLEYILCEMPISKHVYHMIHSYDQWFMNPHEYAEPNFYVPNLHSYEKYGRISHFPMEEENNA